MTAKDLIGVLERLPDNALVTFGSADPDVPATLYDRDPTYAGVFRAWLTAQKPDDLIEEVWPHGKAVITNWLYTEEGVIFFFSFRPIEAP